MTKILCLWLAFIYVLTTASPAASQKLALITPKDDEASSDVAEVFAEILTASVTVQDRSMSAAAFRAVGVSTPFNMDETDARRVGAVLGSPVFLLLDVGTLRRSASARREYYESYISYYVINARTGVLIKWKLITAEASTPSTAKQGVLRLLPKDGAELVSLIEKQQSSTSEPGLSTGMENIVSDVAIPGSRPPVPFKRVKPEYTQTAYLYDVAATIDIVVDLDESGRITGTRIARWAGYGLDEAVDKAVRSMNWRPAERNGKFVPARFLLRYNFKKPDKN